jgi:hypothetical protein
MPDTIANTNVEPKNRKERREQQRNAAPRQQNNPRPRRKAEDVINNLPAPWAGKVIELTTDLTARKRLALLALRGEYGYKVLLFVRINAIRTTQTEAGVVEAVEAFDILPADPVAAAAEANLLSDDIIVTLSEELADFQQKQAAWQRPEQRPLHQRPFQHRKIAALAAAIQAPAAPKALEVAEAQSPEETIAPEPTAKPLCPAIPEDAWWWAAACV